LITKKKTKYTINAKKFFIPFSERKGYRLLKWVGKSLKTLFVRSNQETVRIIVTNI